MRAIVFQMLERGLPEEVAESLYMAGSISEDALPPRPFAVIRFGVFTRGMGNVKTGNVDIWVHDNPGDYDVIDKTLGLVYGIMDGAEHVPEQDGSAELIQASWTSTSGDLFDPGFRTITKNSSYRLTGTGA